MRPHDVPRLRPGVRARKHQGKLIVAASEHTLELTESAAFIFRSVDGTRSVREVGAMLADRYGIPAETAAEDAREFLGELAENRIIEMGG